MARNRVNLYCKWACCPQQAQVFPSPDELALHVVESHVNPCSRHDLFICQWEGCKVYNRPSYSFGWLQRHVKQKHTKERPNKCLMNGCNMSFNSVDALQKHMLRHFDTQATSSPASTPKKSAASRETSARGTVSKPPAPEITGASSSSSARGVEAAAVGEVEEGGRRNTPVLDQLVDGDLLPPPPPVVYPKQPSLKVKIPRKTLYSSCPYSQLPVAFNGAHFHSEVMDQKTMSVIRHTTNNLAYQNLSSPSIMLTSKIVGERRQDLKEEREVLVRWTPKIVPDEWVCISKHNHKKVMNFSDLPSSQLSLLASKCYGFDKLHGRRSKRKPNNS